MRKEKRLGYPQRSTYCGYSLLEVLIALCILSIGLLSLAQAQLLALRNNQTAYFQTVAMLQLSSMAERLQACMSISCDVAELTNQVSDWNAENAALLPNGKGQVSGKEITLQWQSNLTATQLVLYAN